MLPYTRPLVRLVQRIGTHPVEVVGRSGFVVEYGPQELLMCMRAAGVPLGVVYRLRGRSRFRRKHVVVGHHVVNAIARHKTASLQALHPPEYRASVRW